MSFKGVETNKLNGGLGGQNPTNDSVMALAYAIPSADLPAGRTHYAQYELLQPKDCDALGFTAAHDAAEKVLINHEVNEFFRLAPSGVLHLIPVPDSLTPVQIMQAAAFKSAIREAKDVKIIGITGTTETLVSLAPLVEGIQAEINALMSSEDRDIDLVILSGRGTATATALSAYPDYRAKNAPNVSVCIAQDPAVAALDAAYAKYATVGAVLGMYAVRNVNESIGSVDIINKPAEKKGDQSYPLNGPTQFLTAALSDGTPVSTLTLADMNALTAKGYIVAGSYSGYPGVYFDLGPTCVELQSDYAWGENNRVWNKAKRLIRAALLPKVKGVVKKDAATGFIRSTTIASWEGLVIKALRRMETAGEISGYSVYIDPKQILSVSSPLKIKASVVKDDIVHMFSVDLGLTLKA